MAKFKIDRLNYITTGRNRIFLNADRRLQSFPHPLSVLLKTEEGFPNPVPHAHITVDKPNFEEHAHVVVDDIRRSEEYKEWTERYRKRNTTPNVSFDIELDQTDDNVDILDEERTNDQINPMYDMVDVHVKSSLGNRKDNFQKFDNVQNQCEDVYNPDMDRNPVQFCKAGQNTYMMTTPTKYESQVLKVRFQNQGNGSYYIPQVTDFQHNTVFHGTADQLGTTDGSQVSSLGQFFDGFSGNSESLQRAVDGYFYGTRQLSGVEYNHVLALTHKNSQRWNNRPNMTEYGNGNVYADIFPLKNMYNSTYSTEMDAPYSIRRSREYCGIGQFRNRIYLKYQDDVQIDSDGYGNGQKTIPNKRTWQKIETMEPASVGYQSTAKHKSLYYSIRLNQTGLEEANPDGNGELDVIRKDIENTIRDIAMKFAPSNTHLFEIQIED